MNFKFSLSLIWQTSAQIYIQRKFSRSRIRSKKHKKNKEEKVTVKIGEEEFVIKHAISTLLHGCHLVVKNYIHLCKR